MLSCVAAVMGMHAATKLDGKTHLKHIKVYKINPEITDKDPCLFSWLFPCLANVKSGCRAM
jgi:hypothetical protein